MLIDPKAAKVRGVAKLTKKDARSSTGLFLLEGPQGLKEALDRPKLIVELFATEDAVERYPDLFERAENARIQVQLVSEPVLKALTDTTTPQGVVAVCEQIDVTPKQRCLCSHDRYRCTRGFVTYSNSFLWSFAAPIR